MHILQMYTTLQGVSGQDYALDRAKPDEILAMRRAGVGSTGQPTRFYALEGHNLLMFYPTPSATDTFTIYYVPTPTALSVSSDDPATTTLGGIPQEFQKAVEFYALAEAADYSDDSSSQNGQLYRALYQAEIKLIRKTLRIRGGSKLPRALVRARSGRVIMPHDRSVWP